MSETKGLLEQQKQDIMHDVKVLLDTEVTTRFNLLAEGQQAIMDAITPKSEIEELRNEVSVLKLAIRTMNQEIAELKKRNKNTAPGAGTPGAAIEGQIALRALCPSIIPEWREKSMARKSAAGNGTIRKKRYSEMGKNILTGRPDLQLGMTQVQGNRSSGVLPGKRKKKSLKNSKRPH